MVSILQQDCLGILEQTAACIAGLKTVSTADRRIFRDCGVFLSQEIASCERKSLRRGAHCPVDNGFAPTETECRLRSPQKRSHILGYSKMPCGENCICNLIVRGTKIVYLYRKLITLSLSLCANENMMCYTKKNRLENPFKHTSERA